MNEFAEKASVIGQILDKIMPIPENAPENVREKIDQKRQSMVLRAGFNTMSIEKLKTIITGG